MCLKVGAIIVLKTLLLQATILNYHQCIGLLRDFHLPCLLNKRSFTRLFASNFTPPIRILCKPKPSFLNQILASDSSKSFQVLVYERNLFTFRSFSVVFVFVMALKKYSSDLSLTEAKLKQFRNILTGHKFPVNLITYVQFSSQYMSFFCAFFFKNNATVKLLAARIIHLCCFAQSFHTFFSTVYYNIRYIFSKAAYAVIFDNLLKKFDE